MQGERLFNFLKDHLEQIPWWKPGQEEMRINCPFCHEKDHKCYVRAYDSVSPTGKTKHAGLWVCFKAKSPNCSSGGNIWHLVPEAGKWAKRSKFTSREEDALPPEPKAKSGSSWIDPGECIPLESLPKHHPGYIYWYKRYYDPFILGSYYGVEWCNHSSGWHQMPDGRYCFDREGMLCTDNHFIFPVSMFGKKIGWQARACGNPAPLIWAPTINDDGYWRKSTAADQAELATVPCDFITTPPKYFHFFNKGEVLGNFDQARNFKTVVVTEGWTKALRVGRCSIVTFGKQISDSQIRLLGNYWDNVILLLDKDAEDLYKDNVSKHGEHKKGLLSRISEYSNAMGVTMDGFDDPGDAPHDEIWRQITLKTGIREPTNNLIY
jgi:hypothetical protein